VPTFDTPAPVSASVDLPAGDVRVAAGDRTDTAVEVAPASPTSKADVRTAEQAIVEYADGRLLVKVPRQPGLLGRTGAVRVTIALPAGSELHAGTASGDVRAEGPLGECTVKTASGDVLLEETGTLRVDTASGDVTVGRVAGDAAVTVRSGDVRIRAVAGAAAVRTTSGDIRLGAVAGDLRVAGAKGDITVDSAGHDVTVKTASGDIRIGEVFRGVVHVETASGDLEIGVREGSAAWLDVDSRSGDVRQTLTESAAPVAGEQTVEVRARVLSGDIRIRRSRLTEPAR
jgi:DUF4097 and DUF4098 domain-containing protein YvlB